MLCCHIPIFLLFFRLLTLDHPLSSTIVITCHIVIFSSGFPDAESIDDSEEEEGEEEEEEEEGVNQEEEDVGYARCSEDDNDSIRPSDDVEEGDEEDEEVVEEGDGDEVSSHVINTCTCVYTNNGLLAIALMTVRTVT